MARIEQNEIFDGNAARVVAPKRLRETREEKKQKEKLIRLTEKQIRKSRMQGIKVSSILGTFAVIMFVTSLVLLSISGQVQINELTGDINDKSEELVLLQSVEVQLQMEVTSSLDVDSIRDYVEQDLGMQAINENQVFYINMANEDKGTVYTEENKNIFEIILGIFDFS